MKVSKISELALFQPFNEQLNPTLTPKAKESPKKRKNKKDKKEKIKKEKKRKNKITISKFFTKT